MGGVILFRDNLPASASAAREVVARIRALAPAGRPFRVLMDEEGGLISQTRGLSAGRGRGRFGDLPTPRALGRIAKPAVAEAAGAILGKRLRFLGVDVDLAPSLDLATEERNPIIGSRSFGNEASLVAGCGYAFARGLRRAGVGACYKHYPGHGGTRLDSHLTLPSMDPRELPRHIRPFRECLSAPMRHGEAATPPPWVMGAHVDWGAGMPASLSPELLRRVRRWSPRSLLVTDALDMKAVDGKGGSAARALAAGNDVLLVGRDWEGGLDAARSLAETTTRDAGLRRAWSRASRRQTRAFAGRPVAKAPGLPQRTDEASLLGSMHRLAIRWNSDPSELLPTGWTWIVPASLEPYVRLCGWRPSGLGRRACRDVIWVEEQASPGRTAAICRNLREATGPLLLLTMFRGFPSATARRAWGAFLELPRLAGVGHLLDEAWPDPAAWRRRGRGGPLPVCFTSGPSLESLDAIAETLVRRKWRQGSDGLFAPQGDGALA